MTPEPRSPRPQPRPALAAALLAATLLAAPAAPEARAQVHANPYQALSDTLQPFLDLVVSKPVRPERAMRCKVRVIDATGLPEEMRGAAIEIAVQYPDRWALAGELAGERFALCRDGQKVWVTPGQKAGFILANLEGLPPEDPDFRLGRFAPPIPEQQLVWFPVLFQVVGDGAESLDGVPCRVLEVALTPEIARSLKADGWRARLWITPENRPAKLALARPGWLGTFRFESLAFAKSLPADQWKPDAPPEDVLWLEAPKIKQLIDWAERQLASGQRKAPR